jgi:para-nitrobenzyl esterase
MTKWLEQLVRGIACTLLIGGAVAGSTAHAAPDKETVVVESGPLRGVSTPEGRMFLGVPYAAPPVGAMRWQPPAPVEHWQGLFDASEFANNCSQPATPFGLASTTEDCLYLNVYTPPVRTPVGPQRDPVIVWIHPGAFQYGESDDYDPRELVQQGVVVVTINYRLGALGWLAHPALTAESPDATSGNYGFMDQQAALRWVQRNIDRFGGDPGNVTIAGESAGGLSVHAHLVSPGSAGLFHRAIAQSGAYALNQPSLATGEAQGSAYATAVGCPGQDLACLRAVPVAGLLAKQSTSATAYMPRVDGVVLPMSIGPALASGQFTRVPVIEGSTHDEFRLFVASLFELRGIPVTAATYPALIAAVLGVPPAVVPLVMAQYPLANYPSPAIALAAIGTDAAFACNTFAAARSLAQYVPTYAYEFNDPNTPMATLPPVSFPYGAYHTGELQYLFDVRPNFPAPSFTPAQEQLSGAMQSYWTQFSRNGDPNSGATPIWPAYQPFAANDFQRLAPASPAPFSSFVFLADHKCAFWAALAGGGS